MAVAAERLKKQGVNMSINKLRTILRNNYGKRQYRIMSNRVEVKRTLGRYSFWVFLGHLNSLLNHPNLNEFINCPNLYI